jgi:hypothetical protein
MKNLNKIRGSLLDYDKIFTEYKTKSRINDSDQTVYNNMSRYLKMIDNYLDIFEYYQDKLNWNIISKRSDLTADFIKKFESKLDIFFVSIHSACSLIQCADVVERNQHNFCWVHFKRNINRKRKY